MLYLDNGPIAKSRVFRRVMDYLGIDVCTHMPQRKDGRKATARANGKVERPLRTVKEMHETLRTMCDWERFCTFTREPKRRLVGMDARILIGGTKYEVAPDLARETVILWWGLFDIELSVEHDEHRYGPYIPVNGPIPLHRYRCFKKTRTEKRAERVEALAKRLELPRATLDGGTRLCARRYPRRAGSLCQHPGQSS